MKLSDLAFACYVYKAMSGYDKSYEELLRAVRPELDFHSGKQMAALLKWLNAWGCRQFIKEYHDDAAKALTNWYGIVGYRLFGSDKDILGLTDEDMDIIETVYSPLAGTIAGSRSYLSGAETSVQVGPTGASKVLFAWRPCALIPWDEAMRADYKLDGSARSYSSFLRRVQAHLHELSDECRRAGFGLADLPKRLGREGYSLTKLVDEFHWVTITRGCRVPPAETLREWASWS